MSIKENHLLAVTKLAKSKTANLDADILLSHILKKPKEFLYTHPEYELTPSQQKRYLELIKRRQKLEPVAYITGTKEFYSRDFFVNKNVLIPRPETETLVEDVIKYISNQQSTINNLSLADVGTGSGCIAITLKKELPKLSVIATDISKKALQVAKKNAKTHNAKISFYHGNLLEPIKNKKIDIIVANLPYVKQGFLKKQKKSPLVFEPNLALDGGKDGMKYYNKLFEQVKLLKHKPKIIFYEMDGRVKIRPSREEKNKSERVTVEKKP